MRENIEHVANIRKCDKKIDLLTSISKAFSSNFYNFDKNQFLCSFVEFLVSFLSLEEVDIYYDNDLLKISSGEVAYFNNKKGVFFRPDILSSPDKFFVDLITIAHEVKHADTEYLNKNSIKKVNEDVVKHIYLFDYDVLKSLGLDDDDSSLLYYCHTNEMISNHFAHNFVLNLLSILKINAIRNDDPLLESLFISSEEKIKNFASSYKALTKKIKEVVFNPFVEKLKVKQKDLLNTIKNEFERIKNDKTSVSIINSIFENSKLLINSFNFYYDEKIINELYYFAITNYTSHPIFVGIYELILSEPSFKITDLDIERLVKMYDKLPIDLKFKDIKIDKESLIESYCKIKYDETFANTIISNPENIENIKTSSDIEKKYKIFLESKTF